jgi:RimJ/RimL family protein N-acetyltransferase
MIIRPLNERDADAYVELRRQALLDSPLAFSASPSDDFVASAEAVRELLGRGREWVIFGAVDPDLVGSVGLFRDRHLKARHIAHLWGMYVSPGHRGRGLGEKLIKAAISHARSLSGITSVRLAVGAFNSGARRLYEQAGFREWGAEPDALRHEGQSVVEHHMILEL